MLTYAFEVISKSKNISDKNKIDLITCLSKYSGAEGMLAGQVVDLLSERESINIDKLNFMHVNKTAALFIASFEFGAILSDVDIKTRDILKKAGLNFGLAFQYFDDISDAKNQNSSDTIKEKSTCVSILGLDKSKKEAESYLKKAFLLLDNIDINFLNLKNLFQSYLIN